MRLVITLGTFDLAHPGHVFLLQQCRRIAGKDGKVIATVNPSAFVEEFKGKAPVMHEDERKAVLREFKSVDEVHTNKYAGDGGKTIDWILQSTYGTYKDYAEVFLVIGTDWAPPKDYYAQLGITQEWLDKRNITMVYIPRIGGFSSTELKQRILDNG